MANSEHEKQVYGSPFYLIWSEFRCWSCNTRTLVVALAASTVNGAKKDLCILSEIDDLPENVVAYVQLLNPYFRLRFSESVGQKVYCNTCPKCATVFDDLPLHCEPGAPFMPISDADAERLTLERLPIDGEFATGATYSISPGGPILESAKRIVAYSQR